MSQITLPTDRDVELTHHRARPADVSLHYVAAGPEDGDLVLLLHGFPDFWYSWREQLPALAAAGYRVVAPDMRGYNRSDRPAAVADYHLDRLVADVAGLIDHCGRDSARVVGHDWGGVVAWQVAADRPALVDRLAILNAPHPSAYERELRSWSDQLLRSWYAFAFQIPRLPEWALARNDFALLERTLTSSVEESDAFTRDDLARYRRAFDRPRAVGAAIDYYRALFRRNLRLTIREGGVGDVDVPVSTLLLWGLDDPALSPALTRGLEEWVPDLERHRYPDASHWVHRERPESVNEELLAFF